MLPSRGIRILQNGRRGVLDTTKRQFSSIQQHNVRSRSILSSHASVSFSKLNLRPSILRTTPIILGGTAIRFQSTINPSAPQVATPSDAPSNAFSLSDSDFDSIKVLDMPESIGYLKNLGLDYGWGPTASLEWILEHIHVFAGTPWWASIALTTILVRVCMFKFAKDAASNAAVMAKLQPITKPIQDRSSALAMAGDTQGAARERQELTRIYARAGVQLWKSMLPIIQFPIGLATFRLLRGMSSLPVPGFAEGGTLWFTNLAVADPYFLLPIGTAAILHLVIKKGGESGVSMMAPSTTRVLSIVLPTISCAVTSQMPAALGLSFFIAGCFSFLQSRAFVHPVMRQKLGMLPLPSAPKAPENASTHQSTGSHNAYYQRRVVLAQRSIAARYEAPSLPSSVGGTRETKDGSRDRRNYFQKLVADFRDARDNMKEMVDGVLDKFSVKREEKSEREKEAERRSGGGARRR